MIEPIQQEASEVSIVIYDAPLPPRYFRISKKFIRTLFILGPLALGCVLLAAITWGIGSRLKATPAPSIPQIMVGGDSKAVELEGQLRDLEASNALLKEKLSAATPTGAADDVYLMAIRRPYGMQNFTSQNRVGLDQFELVQEAAKTSLKFQIISNNPETRVTGHVIVFMVSEAGIMAYPREANLVLAQGIKYSAGEPFSVSRLRPTNAEFASAPEGDSVRFVVYIFTREGDLLLVKETPVYKVGPKP